MESNIKFHYDDDAKNKCIGDPWFSNFTTTKIRGTRGRLYTLAKNHILKYRGKNLVTQCCIKLALDNCTTNIESLPTELQEYILKIKLMEKERNHVMYNLINNEYHFYKWIIFYTDDYLVTEGKKRRLIYYQYRSRTEHRNRDKYLAVEINFKPTFRYLSKETIHLSLLLLILCIISLFVLHHIYTQI